ncbi:MAG: hypothetical protein LBJ20_07225 [Candidatus Methanoplasma sp.]|nr:hypothetical protein [Candidatus Methanoplasma sp.]
MVLDGLGVPRYSSEFSNWLYDDHLKMSLLVLKQYLDVSYRELCGMLSSLKIWKGQTPNHFTLVKFSKRLETDVLGIYAAVKIFILDEDIRQIVPKDVRDMDEKLGLFVYSDQNDQDRLLGIRKKRGRNRRFRMSLRKLISNFTS